MTNDDMISRQNVLRCLTDISYNHCKTQGEADVIDTAKTMVAVMSSAQPEITPDGTLTVSIAADVASVGRILLSQTGTQRGGLYYKDEQPEETCDTCKYGYFGDGMCDYCRVMYQSNYERRTDE